MDNFNPFSTLEAIQDDYITYVNSFQQVKNPEIKGWIESHLDQGSLLWKPPFIQIARPFLPGDSLQSLVDERILHSGVLRFARGDIKSPASPPIHPYRHQVEAIRRLETGKNVVVATGTGSGKSFAFGIPIVSSALKMREQSVPGIKAVIVYPMNALANNQYDDFSARLHGTGIRIARYTGDTKTNPQEALQVYKSVTGRDEPYDSDVLSREEIQKNPPDILMTNYAVSYTHLTLPTTPYV